MYEPTWIIVYHNHDVVSTDAVKKRLTAKINIKFCVHYFLIQIARDSFTFSQDENFCKIFDETVFH